MGNGIKTTNYKNTFIAVADDCPVNEAGLPRSKGQLGTVASLQFEMLREHPYKYTSDEVLFAIHAVKKGISPIDRDEFHSFFSKGQACFRASPLCKRYGWGVHFNDTGKMAIYALESDDYLKYRNDPSLLQTKAMRSKKVK
ncbi:MAG: DUF6157 family protein [Sediminicola sp.]|tara:strand:+ start:52940 stop:53362 length:423 start_codon:yes stop_codon:yes gene_type:complete